MIRKRKRKRMREASAHETAETYLNPNFTLWTASFDEIHRGHFILWSLKCNLREGGFHCTHVCFYPFELHLSVTCITCACGLIGNFRNFRKKSIHKLIRL